MPLLTPNTSDALDMSPIDPGAYKAKITAADAGTSKSGGAKVVVKLDVEVAGKARARQAHLVISGPGSGNFDHLLRSTGFAEFADEYKDATKTDKRPFDTDWLIGQEVLVLIDHQIYNGQTQDFVKDFQKA